MPACYREAMTERHPDHATDHDLHAVTRLAVGVALALLVAKLTAWLMTGSVGMLSAMADSLVDVAASVMTLVAVRYAAAPADAEHRFGHGKAEPLAALAQASLLAGSGLFLGIEAIKRLARPVPVVSEWVGLAVMGAATVVTLALVIRQRRVAAATGSLAVHADSQHYAGDLWLNASVIAGLLAHLVFGIWWLDPLLGVGVTLWFWWTAFHVGRNALDQLLDHELPDTERAEIKRVSLAVEGVLGVHKLRTRAAGRDRFVELHLEFAHGILLRDAHDVGHTVSAAIERAYPRTQVTVHHEVASGETASEVGPTG